jgi:hypothetical protein
MIEQDFIMLIMNCKKYADKAAFQKQTWLQTIPSYIKYYHVIGDEELDCEFKFDNDSNILWIKVADDYNSLPKKVISAYNAVYETFNFKYLFKTDDDQMLVNTRFFDILYNLINYSTPKTHYGGYVVDVKRPYYSEYYLIHPELPKNLIVHVTKYCNGRFYYLSKSAIINLLYKKEIICKEYLEDYAIGYNLDPIYKTDMISLKTDKYFNDMIL